MTSDKKTLCKLGEIEDNFPKKNWVFATNSIVLILILLQLGLENQNLWQRLNFVTSQFKEIFPRQVLFILEQLEANGGDPSVKNPDKDKKVSKH